MPDDTPALPALPTPDEYNASEESPAALDPDSATAPVQCPICAAQMTLRRDIIVASPDDRPRWRVECPNGDEPRNIVAS